MKPTLLILAAGMGSRYGGLKQIDPIGPNGEAIIDYSIYDALRAGFGKLVFVIRRDIEAAFRAKIGQKFEAHVPVEYAYQELDMIPDGFSLPADRKKPWGTGHAILVSRAVIDEPFAVINADDFYGANAYQVLHDYLKERSMTNYALVGFVLRNTLSDHGSVARGICQLDEQQQIKTVVEITNIEKDGQRAKYVDEAGQPHHLSGDELVSMNMWGFTPTIFEQLEHHFKEFLVENINQPKAEFYIPSAANRLVANNQASIKVLSSRDSWFGMTYQEDKPTVIQSIRNLITQGHYPESLSFTA